MEWLKGQKEIDNPDTLKELVSSPVWSVPRLFLETSP